MPFRWIAAVAIALGIGAAADVPDFERFEYPFDVQRFELRSQDQALAMAYMDVRPDAGNGRTVLLLHGKNFCSAYWQDTAAFLVQRGFRVVMPDQVGFCRSSLPTRYQFSFHQLALNTAALLDEIGVPSTAVVGHSMGGMLATRFALLYPERTERLIMVNPIGLEDWLAEGVPYPGIDALYASQRHTTYTRIRDYQQRAYYDGEWTATYDYWARMLAASYAGERADRVAWNHALTADMVLTQPVLYEFSQLRVPAALIVGLRDRTAIGREHAAPEVAQRLGDYPRLARAAADAIPDVLLVELDGVGHMPQFEATEQYLDMLLRALTTP